VLYLGPKQGELVESLKLFSTGLTIAEGHPGRSAPDQQYDTVVVATPDYDALEAAAELVRPGAFLYLEARTTLSGMMSRRKGKLPLRFAADYRTALVQLGFDEIAAHWHWPDFESCAEIVPLDEPTSVLHVLGRRRATWTASLKTAVGRTLVRLGIFAYLVPCFSIVARKAASGPAGSPGHGPDRGTARSQA
jgi:hypothetical protein